FDERAFLLSHPRTVDPDFRAQHLSESFCDLVPKVRMNAEEGNPPTDLSFADGQRSRTVIFHPWATYGPAKRWLAERFAELGRLLSTHLAAQIVLVGSADGSALAAEINRLMDDRAIDLTGRTSLSELMDLIRDSALVISTDSGPAHVADAL